MTVKFMAMGWFFIIEMYDICLYQNITNKYRKVSNIRRTKSQNLNASRLIL